MINQDSKTNTNRRTFLLNTGAAIAAVSLPKTGVTHTTTYFTPYEIAGYDEYGIVKTERIEVLNNKFISIGINNYKSFEIVLRASK